jgi:multidrug efflux pump subunit AcrB
MSPLLAAIARHPTAANLVMLIFIVLGALSLPELRRETFPEYEPSSIRIAASYPGAPAEVIDETVVEPLEDVLATLEGIDRLSSRSREGSASLTVEVADDVDFDGVLTEVKSAVDGVRDLPEAVDDVRVSAATRTASVASVAVTGPMSPQDLKLYCEQLRRDLLRYGEVSMVSLAGFSTHQLQVRLRRTALSRHALSVQAVADAIAAQSLDLPLGSLAAREGDILVRYSDKRTSPEALAEVVVKSGATGGEVRLGELAEIVDTFAVDEEQTYFNGERACMLGVTKTSTQDSLEVLAAVREFLADQEERKPAGVTLTLTQDIASVIQDRLDLLIVNGIQGLLLVFATLWLFFGIRLGFWVAAGLPISFLGALFTMNALGLTLNMMTMLGLLVALGLLMDDAIVLAENVAAHLARGKSPMRAAVDGVREVAGGVLSSFVTTICVFLPLSAIEGRIGRVLQVVPAVLIAVLAVSLIEAFFVLPAHLGHSLRPHDATPRGPRARFIAGFERLKTRLLGPVIDAAIRRRYATVGLTIATLLVAIGTVTSGRLAFVSFPDTEGDVVQFRLAMPPGTSLERTKEVVDRMVEGAWAVSDELSPDQPRGEALVRNVSARYNYNQDVTDESGPHLATVSVDLLSVEVRETTLSEFQNRWREASGPMPRSASSRVAEGGRRGPGGDAIELKIEGDDLDRLKEAAVAAERWLEGFPGVADVTDNLQPGAEQVRIRLRPGAGSAGLTGQAIGQQLRAALSGVSVETVHDRGEAYELFVELEHRSRDTVADLESMLISTGDASSVPLGAIARIEEDRSFAQIARVDGLRTVTVTASADREAVNVASLMRTFRDDALADLESEFPDVRFVVGGETEESAATLGSMGRGLLLGLFGIFVLLSLQFRSYVTPLVVMSAVPFAFIGVVFGSLMIGAPLSSQSVLGLVSLAGVVVNDSILLMVFIDGARSQGATAAEAAAQAGRDRFRAVLLTSVTTIAGLVPLMFETSRQAQSLIPVATAIVFGISASTVLVLIVLPAVYAVLDDLGLVREYDSERDPAG